MIFIHFVHHKPRTVKTAWHQFWILNQGVLVLYLSLARWGWFGAYVKLLVYDGSGFWLCQKRFLKGRLAWWPVSKEMAVTIKASELILLLAQGNPTHAALPEDWRRIPLGCNSVESG